MRTLVLSIMSIVLLTQCSPRGIKSLVEGMKGYHTQSSVMIGESRYYVDYVIDYLDDFYEGNITRINSGDTLGYVFFQDSIPFQSVFVLKNDTVAYQEMDIYCSPCAESLIDQILSDSRYHFKAIDEVNYTSTKKIKAVMRLREPGSEVNACHRVRVRMVE